MKELTYEEWIKNPIPRLMWVWNSSENNKKQRKVIYFLDPKLFYPIVALSDDEISTNNFKHCAEIGNTRRMTYQELSWWLSDKPHREYKYKDTDFAFRTLDYKESKQNEEVTERFLIRENNGEWREPIIEQE